MSKRPRSPDAASARPASQVDSSAGTSPSLVEEVVIVEETSDVLVRFPCFDFFRTVHLCERTSKETTTTFAPDAVQFVPASLSSEHPILVINPATEREMIFGCSWAEVCSPGGALGGTNRAIVHVADKAPTPTPAHDDQTQPSAPVPSLLGHIAGGVTADEDRAQRLDSVTKAQNREYDLITAPTAVLVAQRLH